MPVHQLIVCVFFEPLVRLPVAGSFDDAEETATVKNAILQLLEGRKAKLAITAQAAAKVTNVTSDCYISLLGRACQQVVMRVSLLVVLY